MANSCRGPVASVQPPPPPPPSSADCCAKHQSLPPPPRAPAAAPPSVLRPNLTSSLICLRGLNLSFRTLCYRKLREMAWSRWTEAWGQQHAVDKNAGKRVPPGQDRRGGIREDWDQVLLLFVWRRSCCR